ncbi:GNAT family N-acetyltransferase [Novosphingobium terrae]|uniref:GNAT family N-acetyltransferase n=1 Tax=Novosphingobium terrae TaxID=2726189 RepID=UPI00197FC562|nr:GNAT family N-acetyltransferase [Novosphingobium terrae]
MSPLDRPIWSAFNGPQAALAQWNSAKTALRIDPGYGPFVAAAPGEEHALIDLLTSDEDQILVVEPEGFTPPPGLQVVKQGMLMQMVAQGAPPAFDPEGIALLGEDDVADMGALALANQPGPWAGRTHLYGDYFGIRHDSRVVAMAGERMRPAAGFAEVSGVCTDPAFRGRGYAAKLIGRVMAGFAARGDAAFLHSWANNAGAIALYEQLGFTQRIRLVAMALRRG